MHPKICTKFFEADLPCSPKPLRAIFISRFMGPKDVSSQRTAAQLGRLLHIKNYVFAYIIGLETRLLHTARKLSVLCDLASLNKHVNSRFFCSLPYVLVLLSLLRKEVVSEEFNNGEEMTLSVTRSQSSDRSNASRYFVTMAVEIGLEQTVSGQRNDFFY